MKKVTSALLAAVALSSAAFAAEKGSMTGFYLGANVGAANTNVKYDWKVDGVSNATTRAQLTKTDGGKMGFLFGAFAGYGMGFGNNAYVGAEVYGGLDTTKVNTLDDSASGTLISLGKASVKRTNYYGIAPRLGYMITPSTLAYVRLGVEAGKWTAEYAPNAAAVDANIGTADPATAKATRKASKNSISLAPGLGFETALSKNLFVRAEYSYLFGPKMNIDYDISKLTNGNQFNGTKVKQTFKVTQHAFKVGVGYKF
jgi:opacity protein-like surface antigen